MNKFINFIKSFKTIKTTEEAILKGLSFKRNLYGQEILYYDCRSFWVDKYNFIYNCEQYYDIDNEIKLRKIKIKKILKNKKLWNTIN